MTTTYADAITPRDIVSSRTVDQKNLYNSRLYNAFVQDWADRLEATQPYASDTDHLMEMVQSYRKSYRVKKGSVAHVSPAEVMAYGIRLAIAENLLKRAL